MSDITGKRLLLTGATGMVGSLVVDLALAHPEVAQVTTLGRRATGRSSPKLREIEHADLNDFSGLGEPLADFDAAIYCLGVYTGTVPDAELRRVTADFVATFAEALHRNSPEASVVLLSGQGADRREKSRMAFARYKGMAENALARQGFPRVHFARPGYIYPVTPRTEPNVSYRIFRTIYPILRPLLPNAGIPSDDLARAMLEVALHGTPGHEAPEIENRDLRRISVEVAGRADGAVSGVETT